MKLQRIFYLFSSFILIIMSCTPSSKILDKKEDALFNQWLGHPKSQLIQRWGLPDSTFTDGKAGQILLYKEAIDYKSVMNSKYTGPQISFRKEMYVNADSIVYNWRAWRRK